jgi:hypothetical protein
MGKRTLDLPSYGAMPQPTTLTHTSKGLRELERYFNHFCKLRRTMAIKHGTLPTWYTNKLRQGC